MGPGTAAIATWRELAASLAGLARSIRAELCRDGLDEPSTDAAAQDLVCRWFAARLLNGEGPSAGGCVPRTGPVPLPPAARELRERAWGLLTRVDREAILRDFEGQRPGADPAIHFYEEFLAAYDPDRRMRQGVFYTPRPVVRFILHAVHERLRSEFGLAGGLADVRPRRDLFPAPQGALHPDAPFVQILDLAAGTGAFLVEAIDIIHRTLRVQWRAAGWSEGRIIDLWRDYVPRHLLPRLHGLELMPAACTLANLNLSLKLRATGYAHPGELAVVRPGDSLKRLLTGAGAVSSTPVSGEPGGQDARPPGRAGRRCRGTPHGPKGETPGPERARGYRSSVAAGLRAGRPHLATVLVYRPGFVPAVLMYQPFSCSGRAPCRPFP